MADHKIRTRTGEEAILNNGALERFEERLRGRLITADDPTYDLARAVYNASIDRRPALIARCVDVADVMACLELAREEDLLLSVKGGGHSGPGLGVCDGGLMIDLSMLKGIRVDPKRRTVRVEGGCLWGDVDHGTHAFGLATVSGVLSTTGVAGLTLGGGHGYLTRKYGLTIDNLLEADMVLADGHLVTVGPQQNEDLFWAIRGGGGNFGIVTSFLFRLHPVDMVCAGPILWHRSRAMEALRLYRDFMAQAPEEMSAYFAFMRVPAADPFPREHWGENVCGVVVSYLGPQEEAERVARPLLELGPPLFQHVEPMPYPKLQSLFDVFYPPGMHWHWKGDFITELSDEAIDLHVEFGSRVPTQLSAMHLYPTSGAAQRVGPNDTAFSFREANWSQVIVGVDPTGTSKRLITDWTRRYYEALHPYSAGGAYVNFLMEEGQERVQATYRDNYNRLVRIKSKYDPKNLFRINQNIVPR